MPFHSFLCQHLIVSGFLKCLPIDRWNCFVYILIFLIISTISYDYWPFVFFCELAFAIFYEICLYFLLFWRFYFYVFWILDLPNNYFLPVYYLSFNFVNSFNFSEPSVSSFAKWGIIVGGFNDVHTLKHVFMWDSCDVVSEFSGALWPWLENQGALFSLNDAKEKSQFVRWEVRLMSYCMMIIGLCVGFTPSHECLPARHQGPKRRMDSWGA